MARKTISCKQCGKRFHEPWQVAQHARLTHAKHARNSTANSHADDSLTLDALEKLIAEVKALTPDQIREELLRIRVAQRLHPTTEG